MKRLILIDAHAIIHRAYHALPPFTTPAGEPSGAVYGFSTILLRILRELKPDYIAAAFDLPGPTFRHTAYERYKSNRPETPSDLAGQFIKTEELLEAFGIIVFKKPGFEADDIIGTIVEKVSKSRRDIGIPTSLSKNKNSASGQKDLETIIVTGDTDALQLVGPQVKVYAMKKGITETIIYDEDAVYERYGFKPSQLVDYKGLKGDPSDNIPGVKGIGEKTATDLIKFFGTIENLYKALKKGLPAQTGGAQAGDKKISETVAAKLRQGEEEARFSKELATINTEVPIEFDLEKTSWKDGSRNNEIRELFQKFGFYSLIKRLGEPPAVLVPEQAALLSVLSPVESKKNSEIKPASSAKDLLKHAGKKAGLILSGGELFLLSEGKSGVLQIDKKILSDKEAKPFFEKRGFYVYDGKAIIRFLRGYGIEIGPIQFDIILATYLTSTAGRDFSYLAIVSRELARPSAEDLREELIHFFEVAKLLEKKVSENGFKNVFYEMEIPVSRILADMEEKGILIDKKFLVDLAKEAEGLVAKLTKEIYKLAGQEFNIKSSQQLSVILFEKLGIRTLGLRKTEKGGVTSTRESELEKLRSLHPIIEKILQYREITKLKSTYIDVLPLFADKKTGRVHTTFNQAGTVTGRLSSSDPNLQNIPILSEFGREIRKAFVAAPGFVLASFDYSQIELRVAAHMADDKKMIEAFNNGVDIHTLTASQIYHVSLEKVTSEQRRAAKTLNFGVLYGMGPQSFSEATGFSREEAKTFISEYFKNFSGVQSYIANTKRFAQDYGYVETLFGRRRYIPEIYSSNWQLRREAERMAVNMPIQGTATGDIVKMAMINLDSWVKKEELQGDVQMLLQVHDELLFEIKEKMVKNILPEIKKIMERVAELKVPLVVDAKTGPNWGEQKVAA